jgi:hypothetical protein
MRQNLEPVFCLFNNFYNFKDLLKFLKKIMNPVYRIRQTVPRIINTHSSLSSNLKCNCSNLKYSCSFPFSHEERYFTSYSSVPAPIKNIEEHGIKLDIDLIQHLERTSLVDFDNEEALRHLEEAVNFANTLFEVDTSGVEPLTSILENE